MLDNCPFHALAREHPRTVCEMRLHLPRGVLDGLDDSGVQACLELSPGHCCVRLEPSPSASAPERS
ncbi:hypothetical protein RCO28_24430 [Streptomyces sp. LHD-70]|nr:hypothetical protein [Streptomyces sp. LHD-70]MDQ8705618.1 hypothetical protein [Streptomyces sp. LHD-70]